MDGENNGTPYFLMDDLGGFNPLFSETPKFMSHLFPADAEAESSVGCTLVVGFRVAFSDCSPAKVLHHHERGFAKKKTSCRCEVL